MQIRPPAPRIGIHIPEEKEIMEWVIDAVMPLIAPIVTVVDDINNDVVDIAGKVESLAERLLVDISEDSADAEQYALTLYQNAPSFDISVARCRC